MVVYAGTALDDTGIRGPVNRADNPIRRRADKSTCIDPSSLTIASLGAELGSHYIIAHIIELKIFDRCIRMMPLSNDPQHTDSRSNTT